MFGHDHAGHGQSEGNRANIASVDEYADDVVQHCLAVRENTGLPLFLLGHSMGGMVAVRCAIQHPKLWTGVILQVKSICT